jgi:hypothetical protein
VVRNAHVRDGRVHEQLHLLSGRRGTASPTRSKPGTSGAPTTWRNTTFCLSGCSWKREGAPMDGGSYLLSSWLLRLLAEF